MEKIVNFSFNLEKEGRKKEDRLDDKGSPLG